MTGRTVVLTGGTAGIGAELAKQLRQAGCRVVVVGRRAPDGDDSIHADLSRSDSVDCVQAGLQRLCVERWDLLIHNAAVGWVGAFPEQPPSSISDHLHINVWAPIALTHRLLSFANKQARFVFVSSPIAHLPSPDYAVYAASKAALEAFSRALRAERCGVEVQVLRPGATASEMLTDDDARRLDVAKTSFAAPETTATRMIAKLAGSPRWSGTDWPSRLAAPMQRWGLTGWISRQPRTRWPSDLLKPAPMNRPRTALVTGAAEGLGRALGLRFAADGWLVVGIDCNPRRLAETQQMIKERGGRCIGVVADLSVADEIERMLHEIAPLAPFDAIVHNAGVNRFGRFAESKLDEQYRVFQVNLLAPIVLMRELAARGFPNIGCRLGFISSLSHFVGYPGSAVYAATKSGLASIGLSLAEVGCIERFSATTIFPGPMKTRQAFENSPDNRREHRRADPAKVADAVHRAMMQGRRTLIPGKANRLAAEFARRIPSMSDAVMRKALLHEDTL